MLAPGLPFSLDPLIGEARQRARRRRLGLLLALLAGSAALAFALWPSGAPPAGSAGQAPGARQQLSRASVPVDTYERQWRQWVQLSNHGIGPYLRPAAVRKMRREIRAAVAASGARVVRLDVWDVHWGAPVELVVATAVRPAVYLQDDLGRVLSRIHGGYRYVKVVDRNGTSIFENGYRTRGGHLEGTVGVPRPLQGCSPVPNWGPTPPPCPAN